MEVVGGGNEEAESMETASGENPFAVLTSGQLEPIRYVLREKEERGGGWE